MNSLSIITNWFAAQCDGDWEHENIIKIYSLDNPGWGVDIDLTDTSLENVTINHKSETDDLNWFEIVSDGKKYQGYGGVNNLDDILSFFATDFIKKSAPDFLYDIYGLIKNTEPKVWRKYHAELIDGNLHLIKEIPDLNHSELKFEDFEDLKDIDFSQINDAFPFSVDDVVKCELKMLADYPVNVIINKA